MSLSIRTDPVPLHVDADGVVRVGGTRVTLETLLHAYREGATPETIQQDFSTLSLADIHAVIAYYLRHGPEVDTYLQQQEQEAAEVRRQNEARFPPDGIRERLLARRCARAGDQSDVTFAR